MLDLIGEFFAQVIVELIGYKILVPFFRLTGGAIRWSFSFGRQTYQDILNKSYNGRLGLMFWLALIITLIYFIKK
jgi:hypothetical protein